ncbi:hypothetical protein Ahy_B05g079348 [Arachis hypogaea]|uniref:Uncharacterized protein n=1 Tax=Arachis hypogaea TaxID=3818 RepID=A0A444Z9L7_ARAHY|nr:hypothetical protein Ahy_B05g079348 [Arachis hypogaea]
MFSNRKERCELLEALLISYKHINIPIFSQRIHLLWGENDKIFKKELAHNMKEIRITWFIWRDPVHLIPLSTIFFLLSYFQLSINLPFHNFFGSIYV